MADIKEVIRSVLCIELKWNTVHVTSSIYSTNSALFRLISVPFSNRGWLGFQSIESISLPNLVSHALVPKPSCSGNGSCGLILAQSASCARPACDSLRCLVEKIWHRTTVSLKFLKFPDRITGYVPANLLSTAQTDWECGREAPFIPQMNADTNISTRPLCTGINIDPMHWHGGISSPVNYDFKSRWDEFDSWDLVRTRFADLLVAAPTTWIAGRCAYSSLKYFLDDIRFLQSIKVRLISM